MQKVQVTIFIAILLIFAVVVVITQSASNGTDKKGTNVDISQIPAEITLVPSNNTQGQQDQLQQQQTQRLAQPFNAQALEAYRTASATATIKTSKGDIKLLLYGEFAPLTVANFIKKAKDGFYNNLTFHRVENWVIQGGDPAGNGTGGGNMPVEFNNKEFVEGSLGVASTGNGETQNDAQFFITKEASPHLNGQYTNFGIVTEGIDVVKRIEKGDRILSITIE